MKRSTDPTKEAARFAMHLSRRSFFRLLAKGGAVIAGIGAGIGGFGRGLQTVFALPQLPAPCVGECSLYSSYCYSGGERCFVQCVDCCWLKPHAAFGSWYWISTNPPEPGFSCTAGICL